MLGLTVDKEQHEGGDIELGHKEPPGMPNSVALDNGGAHKWSNMSVAKER